METKLARIAEISENNSKEVFTSLYHLLNKEMLMQCHKELDGDKAVGIDGITKQQYQDNLDENIGSLFERLKKKLYRPQPVRRTYIPKGDGKEKRPLGICAYEDKIVQLGLKRILEAVFEPIFLGSSFGFRPGRNCHDTLKKLNTIIEKSKISYVAVDLSHIPLIGENMEEALIPVKDYLVQVHMGNCVLKDPSLPGYGDMHPRFGFPESENDVEQLAEFLRILMKIGFLNEKDPPVVHFEVKPFGDEDFDIVIANSKRVLNRAWAQV